MASHIPRRFFTTTTRRLVAKKTEEKAAADASQVPPIVRWGNSPPGANDARLPPRPTLLSGPWSHVRRRLLCRKKANEFFA